jgi:hypothetical protein
MPPTTHAVIELHMLDIEAGGWCPCCMRPSAVTVTWAGVDPVTLVVQVRGCSTFCSDCGFSVLEP